MVTLHTQITNAHNRTNKANCTRKPDKSHTNQAYPMMTQEQHCKHPKGRDGAVSMICLQAITLCCVNALKLTLQILLCYKQRHAKAYEANDIFKSKGTCTKAPTQVAVRRLNAAAAYTNEHTKNHTLSSASSATHQQQSLLNASAT